MPSKKKSRKKSSRSSQPSADTPARICFDRIIPQQYAPARTIAVMASVERATRLHQPAPVMWCNFFVDLRATEPA